MLTIKEKRDLTALDGALAKLTGGSPAARKQRAEMEAEHQRLLARMSPDELAKPLMARGEAGWANDVANNRNVLVEGGSGCAVVMRKGLRDAPIVRRPMKPLGFATGFNATRYRKHASAAEGWIPWMYLDKKHNVTVGIGHHIPSAPAAKALAGRYRFVWRINGQRADPARVEEEYGVVKRSLGATAGRAHTYKPITRIDLAEGEIERLYRADVAEALRLIRSLFKGFDSFPEPAALAITDMVYSLGFTEFRRLFKIFQAAVHERHWAVAAVQSKIGKEGQELEPGRIKRNVTVRGWLRKAEQAEPYFLAASGCPRRREDLIR